MSYFSKQWLFKWKKKTKRGNRRRVIQGIPWLFRFHMAILPLDLGVKAVLTFFTLRSRHSLVATEGRAGEMDEFECIWGCLCFWRLCLLWKLAFDMKNRKHATSTVVAACMGVNTIFEESELKSVWMCANITNIDLKVAQNYSSYWKSISKTFEPKVDNKVVQNYQF